MSATDELRRLLDERGVEHEDDEDVTRFFGPNGFEVVMQEDIDGKLDCLTSLYLTPAQAIAASLGESMTDTEKAALERRIDELCEQVERLHADQAHWELGNCPSCPNIADLQEALEQNDKLRKFAAHMANALGIDREWCDTSWCDTDCMVEFGCQPAYCGGETRCPAWAKLRELGVNDERRANGMEA